VTLLVVQILFVTFVEAGPPRELFREANRNYWENNYEQAAGLFREFIEQHPDHELLFDARFGLAQAYFQMDRLNKAAQLFRQVGEEHPDPGVRGDAVYGQIQVALLEDEPGRALKLMESFKSEFADHSLAGVVTERMEDLKPQVKTPDEADTPPPLVREDPPGRRLEFRDIDSPPEKAEVDKEKEIAARRLRTETPPLRLTEDSPPKKPTEIEPEDRVGEKINLLESRVEAQADTIEKLKGQNKSLLREIEDMEEIIAQQQDIIEEQEAEKNNLADENKILRQRLEEDIAEIIAVFDTPLADDKFTFEDLEEFERDSESFRRRARQAFEMGNYEIAWNNIEPLLEAEPRAEDYYFAARITWEKDKDHSKAIDLLEKALEAEDPPVEYILFQAELLLTGEEYERLDTLEENYAPNINREAEDSELARWHYLVGKRLLAGNNRDQAFFRFMTAIRSAPVSRWADEARRVISDEL